MVQMEELYLFWILAGFFVVLALRNLITKFVLKRAINDDYAHDLHDILTKDEHKVKGRFD